MAQPTEQEKAEIERRYEEEVRPIERAFVQFVNANIDSDLVQYKYLRQSKNTGKYEQVTVRFHVEEVTPEEAEELKGDKL